MSEKLEELLAKVDAETPNPLPRVNEDSLRQTYPPDINVARSIVFHYLFAEAKAGRRLMPREPTAEMLKAATPHFEEVNGIIALAAARSSSGGLSRDPLVPAYQSMFDCFANLNSAAPRNNLEQTNLTPETPQASSGKEGG